MNTGYNGFLIANKPCGITSSDLVVFVRRRLPRGTSVGHGGTLDPEASGVLPICVGTAARLFDYIIDKQKVYEAELQLGVITDTQDGTGKVLETKPVNAGPEDVLSVLGEFTGEIFQIPPMYSAIKRDGQRLYALARKGEVIEIEPRKCRVDGIDLIETTGNDRYRIRVRCGKGVYIRTLCHDIGNRLGCGGYMASLKRTSAGIFDLDGAYTRDQIEDAYKNGKMSELLIAPDAPLGHLPKVELTAKAEHAVLNGNILKPSWMKSPAPVSSAVRIYLEGKFAGIGETLEDGSVRFKAMLYDREAKN